MNDRIEIFTRLILELQKIIDKCKELNIRLSQPFLNDYYASQSSLEGAKMGYIIMAARGERYDIVKLREFINGFFII